MRAILSILLFVAAFANGAEWAVNPKAYGTSLEYGTNWTNPLCYPSTFIRGDTYYYADGHASEGEVWDTAESGTQVITIKRATAANHGSGTLLTGWDDSMSVSNTLFNGGKAVRSSYWEFDGVTGSNRTNYGFEFQNYVVLGDVGAPVHNITFRRINSRYFPSTDTSVEKGQGDAQGWNPSDYTSLFQMTHSGTNFVFDGCWIHHMFGNAWQTRAIDYFLVTNCIVEKNKNTPAWHSAMIADDFSDHFTFVNSEFSDIEGSGFIDLVAMPPGGTSTVWRVYNNVFRHTGTWGPSCAVPSIISVNWDGSNDSTAQDWLIAHNTFSAIFAPAMYFGSPYTANVRFVNNLWWGNYPTLDCDSYIYFSSGASHDYNHFSALASTDGWTPNATETAGRFDNGTCLQFPVPSVVPFTDYAAGNFHIADGGYSSLLGTNLATLLPVAARDRDGVLRVNFTPGAYVFVASSPSSPSTITGLRFRGKMVRR